MGKTIEIDETPEQASDVLREEVARLSQKISSRVRIQRWGGQYGPLVGPSVIIANIDKVAEGLAMSGFMLPWIVGAIKAHLLSGGTFKNTGTDRSGDEMAIVSNGESLSIHVRSEYRMATEKEILDYVDHEQYANLTGKTVTRRAQETAYVLHYHEGPKLIEAYDNLPRQAKVILDLLNDTGRETFTEASIEVILAEKAGLLKTKQDPIKIFGFYRRRLIDDGHLEESE